MMGHTKDSTCYFFFCCKKWSNRAASEPLESLLYVLCNVNVQYVICFLVFWALPIFKFTFNLPGPDLRPATGDVYI